MIATARPRLDNGLPLDDLALSCLRVFALVQLGHALNTNRPGRTRVTTGTYEPGWAAVAEHAAVLAIAGTGHYTVPELAGTLRKAYARAHKVAGTEAPFDRIPPILRLAWESVARHVVWATQAARSEVRDGIAAAEEYRAEFAERDRLKRGISRE